MSSVSQILRTTREAKGITLEDVAQRTYIKLPYLAALEEGRIEDLLAPVFVHGYIRQYCRLLGLNAAELVQQYQHEVKSEHPKLAPVPVLTTADAELVRIPLYAVAETGNGNGNGSGNGHVLPFSRSDEEALPPSPISSTEVHLVERTVSMERPAPMPYSGENGHHNDSKETATAQQEAQRVLDDAHREADRLRKEAEQYAYHVLSSLEGELGRTLAIIKNGRQFLQQRRRHAISDK